MKERKRKESKKKKKGKVKGREQLHQYYLGQIKFLRLLQRNLYYSRQKDKWKQRRKPKTK